ncbi:MAG TPA: 16S rRNA (adenine(1518)-N(6)/adenine(1519)-N(6))-dimethyltransferase RsmA [Candidatus Paceibacterota bacterium]|nr:16S rRNA (adenine(1518)-N(6)/adenine(1519)-N(6))-dimethyltransferase RsmA [Candidatus Paceibacterota bacterium]
MTTSIRAKKSLGQNFLVNRGVIARIVAAADIGPGDTVLEVGPGTGALTRALADTGATVIALEKDDRLIGPLTEQFKDSPNVRIVHGDALELDAAELGLGPGLWKLVANIPYYLTSRLIRLMLERWRPEAAVLMVQREVAERMLAKPPEMNLLSLSVQLYAHITRVMDVSRGSFRPIPDVDSAVIRLESMPDADHELNERAMTVAKRAFAHKRKQLKFGPRPSARPQELSVDDWKKLA